MHRRRRAIRPFSADADGVQKWRKLQGPRTAKAISKENRKRFPDFEITTKLPASKQRDADIKLNI